MATDRTFENTRLALVEFDKTAAKRQRLWNSAASNEDIFAAEKADADALADVQTAFHKDTFDINSREHCARADEQFMRRMANGPDPDKPQAPNRVKMVWDKTGKGTSR